MKYCLFDGGDVVGPFSAEQLLLRPGFGAHSLVCPEEHSDEEAFWKEARLYKEFGFSPLEQPAPPLVSAPHTDRFLREMSEAVTELDALSVREKDMPAPPKPARPSGTEQTSAARKKQKKTSEAARPEPPQKKKQKISSVLMQASEEMKKQRAVRATSRETKKQEKETSVRQPTRQEPVSEEKKQSPAPAAQSAAQPPAEPEVVERTISQMSPIEEYFNTVKSGDLGRILGIPDPKENSDMNLVRALESQFEKTDPGTGKPMDDDPFDEFTPKEQVQDAGQELLNEILPPEADKKTQENLSHSLPDLQDAQPLPLKGQAVIPSAEESSSSGPAVVQEMVVPVQEDDDPNDKTVKTILEGQLKVDTLRQEIPEPIKEVPPEEHAAPPSAAAERVKEHVRQVKEEHDSGGLKFFFLGLGLIVLLTGAYLNWAHHSAPLAEEEQHSEKLVSASAQEERQQAVPAARAVLHAQPQRPVQDPLELAKKIVQNYQLDNGRGTVEEYLNKLYRRQLQEGYAAMWSAEPLHKDSYVVKYRLAKTRKEPIVYIFQADTAKKKLTGALNNITLDLVGKIS